MAKTENEMAKDFLRTPLWTIVLLFYVLLFITALIVFSDIYLPLQGREGEFQFKNFLIYNYLLKGGLYIFKFAGLFLLFRAVLNVGRVRVHPILILKSIVIAELLFFIPDLVEIAWYYGFCSDCTIQRWEQVNAVFYPLSWFASNSERGLFLSVAETIGIIELAYVGVVSSLVAYVARKKIWRITLLLGTVCFACSLFWALLLSSF